MKYIAIVTDFDPGAGNEYSAANYPGTGFFYVARSGVSYFVNNNLVTAICGPCPVGVEISPKTAVTIDDVAKLLAVSLHESAANRFMAPKGDGDDS